MAGIYAAEMTHRLRLPFGALLLAAVLACAGMAAFVVRSVSSLSLDERAASTEFDAVLDTVPSKAPLLIRDASGVVVRRSVPPSAGSPPTALHVLAYHVAGERLVRSDLPLWFVSAKGPLVRYALRDTRLDLDELRVTATDLRAAGAGVVLDETRANGDRLLVWTD